LAGALRPSSDLSPASLTEELTPRELEVLQLLAEGLSNKALAYQLDISEHTVKFHVNSIMGKLDAQSRTGRHTSRSPGPDPALAICPFPGTGRQDMCAHLQI
jgi:DNA-binding CsgD family transcriptional regulator